MKTKVYEALKRATDIAAATAGLIITAPLQAGIAIAIRIKLGSPVLFRQERPGKSERIFTLIKFRTMAEPDPRRGIVSDEDRLTPLGKFLRSTSMDELPTLWNVLRGHMSLVGPRPLRTYYLPLYTPEQARRHEVRPGVTGLAQVRGRNSLSWEDRFRADVEYVDNRSIMLDIRILLMTIWSVARRTGISANGHATMPPFMGNSEETPWQNQDD